MRMSFVQLSKVEMLRIARNRYFMIYSILLPIVYYVILSYTNKQVNHAYLLISMLLFSLLSGAVTTFAIGLAADNNQDWRKLMKTLPISETTISGAKLFSQLLFNALSVVILLSSVHFLHPLNGTLWQWGVIALWFIFTSAIFMTIGVVIGSIGKPETVSGLANLSWIIIMITAGTWFSFDEFPLWVQFISSISPGALAASGAFLLIEGNVQVIIQVVGLLCYGMFFMGLHFIIVKLREKEVFGR